MNNKRKDKKVNINNNEVLHSISMNFMRVYNY
uniref:Uncharacterized protein n=1 Tax=Amphimedon queenslandica TaxID=400682 RepID=A0A1X7UY24_AMPQE